MPAEPTPFAVTVVGIGEDGWEGLAGPAREALAAADVVLGGPRQLDLVAGRVRAPQPWPRDLAAAAAALPTTHAGRRVAVLASGDPMHFGVGTTLVRALGADRVRVLPTSSSISLACARLGWPVEEVAVVSAVGRPYPALLPELHPGARILVLTGDEDGAAQVGRLVAERGLDAELTVLERLGGPHERVRAYAVRAGRDGGPNGGPNGGPAGAVDASGDATGPLAENALPPPPHDRLTIVAVRCAPTGTAGLTGRATGLPDDVFATDGVLTKQEIRAVTLAALAPLPGELLWDVGAGSGSVTAEWLRADRRCRAVAVEPRADRLAHVRHNARRLAGAVERPASGGGVATARDRLRVVEGRAPAALAGLPTPDAVFVGGGAGVPGVIDACLAALRPGGRLVANAVTVETEAVLVSWQRRAGGRLRRIQVSHAEPVGSYTAFRPALPVTQWVHTMNRGGVTR